MSKKRVAQLISTGQKIAIGTGPGPKPFHTCTVTSTPLKFSISFHCALKYAVGCAAQPLLFFSVYLSDHSQKCARCWPSTVNQETITCISAESPLYLRLHFQFYSRVLISAQFKGPFFFSQICNCFSVIQISYSRKVGFLSILGIFFSWVDCSIVAHLNCGVSRFS